MRRCSPEWVMTRGPGRRCGHHPARPAPCPVAFCTSPMVIGNTFHGPPSSLSHRLISSCKCLTWSWSPSSPARGGQERHRCMPRSARRRTATRPRRHCSGGPGTHPVDAGRRGVSAPRAPCRRSARSGRPPVPTGRGQPGQPLCGHLLQGRRSRSASMSVIQESNGRAGFARDLLVAGAHLDEDGLAKLRTTKAVVVVRPLRSAWACGVGAVTYVLRDAQDAAAGVAARRAGRLRREAGLGPRPPAIRATSRMPAVPGIQRSRSGAQRFSVPVTRRAALRGLGSVMSIGMIIPAVPACAGGPPRRPDSVDMYALRSADDQTSYDRPAFRHRVDTCRPCGQPWP